MKGDYEPMVAVASNRQVVRLKDGRTGRLIFWSIKTDDATVYMNGRHVGIKHDDILCVVQDPVTVEP